MNLGDLCTNTVPTWMGNPTPTPRGATVESFPSVCVLVSVSAEHQTWERILPSPRSKTLVLFMVAGFVLHVASKGDKARATRSTFGRNRKCCCEHQLLLVGWVERRGLSLPRRCQIKRPLCSVGRHTPPTLKIYFSKGVKVHRWEGPHTFSSKGYEGCHRQEHYLHSVALLQLV